MKMYEVDDLHNLIVVVLVVHLLILYSLWLLNNIVSNTECDHCVINYQLKYFDYVFY